MESKTELAITDAVTTATDFVKLFYEVLDKRRHAALKLYLDSAQLVWNGGGVDGAGGIVKFLENLPTTDHTIQSVDAQPIPDVAVGGQTTVCVSVGGYVRVGGRHRSFSEHFVLTAYESKWKIVSDTFRYVQLVA